MEERYEETLTPMTLYFQRLIKYEFHDEPGVYESFYRIVTEYRDCRIEHSDMCQQVSRLFSAHPEMIRVFHKCYPQTIFTEDDDEEASRPAKRAKTEDDSSETEFDPTSNASTSYASKYCESPCFYTPEEKAAAASCSSSSTWSRHGNAAQAFKRQEQEIAAFIDGTLYLPDSELKLLSRPRAYKQFEVLVNEISAKRMDAYVIMKRASHLFQGYPRLIKDFNKFLPEGFSIVVLSGHYDSD